MTAAADPHRTAEECFRFVASAFSAQLRRDIGKLTGHSGPRLQECASRAFRLRLLDDPVRCHSSAIAAAMTQAMAAILASAGFAVEDANDDYRSHQLRVTDGPAQAAPMWTLRDEEVTLPGRQAAGAGDGTDRLEASGARAPKLCCRHVSTRPGPRAERPGSPFPVPHRFHHLRHP